MSMFYRALGFILIFSFVSCAQFQTGRSYLTEMEQDDSRFFTPKEDFPILSGDTGRDWYTDKEMRSRIPATEEELAESRYQRSLKSELRNLENSQSESGLAYYEENKSHFQTTSEKIFFLKLLPNERKDYLLSRGFIKEPKVIESSFEEAFGRRPENQEVFLGMKKDEVISSLGRPERVEVAGNPRNENERWLYKTNSASSYIYFESGKVQGWERH